MQVARLAISTYFPNLHSTVLSTLSSIPEYSFDVRNSELGKDPPRYSVALLERSNLYGGSPIAARDEELAEALVRTGLPTDSST